MLGATPPSVLGFPIIDSVGRVQGGRESAETTLYGQYFDGQFPALPNQSKPRSPKAKGAPEPVMAAGGVGATGAPEPVTASGGVGALPTSVGAISLWRGGGNL